MIVIPKKDNDIRISVDMRHVNKSIQRINHLMPSMEVFRTTLRGSKIFSKLDIKNAYSPTPGYRSRHLTTFMSPIGLLRYTRFMFGINCAPEIFQKVMDEIFSGCDGVVVYIDDILVGGTDQADHDIRLKKVLQKIKQFNLSLNNQKCEYNKTEIEFMGYLISAQGIEISPSKIEAIKHFRKPISVSEVRSFLGLVTFVGHWIDYLATKTEPLRKLLKNDKFEWNTEQDNAFDNIRDDISKNTLKLGYFDPKSETFLYTDASGTGIAGILCQKEGGQNRIITCIERSLTKTEQNFPQVQREALAIVWATEVVFLPV